MKLIDFWHERHVADRRANVISHHLAEQVPPDATVLDIGCGDGRVAALLGELRPDIKIRGLDVKVRASSQIPVEPFDGQHLPCETNAYDVVMFVDVLHHTDDPLVLLREAARVASRAIILKDHLCDGFLAGPTLRFMDRVGNRRFDVALPHNYWPQQRWRDAFENIGGKVDDWNESLRLYWWPASLLFDRSLHFIARVSMQESQTTPSMSDAVGEPR